MNIKRALAMLFVIGLVVVVSLGGLQHQNDVEHLSSAVAQIKEQRVTACEQYNLQQRQQIAAEKAEIRTLVGALAPPPLPPEVEARVKAFLPLYDRTVDNGHRMRDCSPAGINRYLTTKGTT